jgi:hypothetical protein
MSVTTKIETTVDSASPELKLIQQSVTPHRMAAEVGPRFTRLVQRNFLKKERSGNSRGWPSQHFYARAAQATNWQEGFGFVTISVNQIGVRQRLLGGPIKPTGGRKYLTIPAVPEAYGKRASEFNNLEFGFAADPENPGTVAPALVERKATNIKIGKQKKDGSRSIAPTSSSTGLTAIFWLLAVANQKPDPSVMPSDEEFQTAMDESVDVLLRYPTQTN